MKKILMTLLAATALSTAWAGDQIVVRQTSGDYAVECSQVAEITFPTEGGIVLTTVGGENLTFGADSFVSIHIKEAETGLSAVTAAKQGLAITGNTLQSAVEGITVYDVDGKTVSHTSGSDLNVANLLPGVYVAVSGESNIKFVVK
jgi:hypothetical protein